MWWRRSWFSLKGKAGIPGQTEGRPATSIGPRVLPVGSLQQRDACACLWLQGELVHLEDLVLHDAGMDQRAPTHELTRAHAVLRTRRRIASTEPDWATSPLGLAALSKGREGEAGSVSDDKPALDQDPAGERAG